MDIDDSLGSGWSYTHFSSSETSEVSTAEGDAINEENSKAADIGADTDIPKVQSNFSDAEDNINTENSESADAGKVDSDKAESGDDVAGDDSETASGETGNESDGESSEAADAGTDAENSENNSLSEEEKADVKRDSGWSNEIVDSMRSKEEYEIYKNAGLKESEVDGKKCLIREDIDWAQKDVDNHTNRERIENGLAPQDKDGRSIELHHVGQRSDSPLAELTMKEHRGKGNDTILHDKTKESEVHDDGNTWNTERAHYWKHRI